MCPWRKPILRSFASCWPRFLIVRQIAAFVCLSAILIFDIVRGEKMSPSKTQMAGFFVAGAAVGAVITLLFAPRSGAQTRKDIRRFSKKTVNQLGELQKDVRDQVSGGVGGVLELMKQYVKDGKSGLHKRIQTVV
jgi:gas vesicle protein